MENNTKTDKSKELVNSIGHALLSGSGDSLLIAIINKAKKVDVIVSDKTQEPDLDFTFEDKTNLTLSELVCVLARARNASLTCGIKLLAGDILEVIELFETKSTLGKALVAEAHPEYIHMLNEVKTILEAVK